VSELAKLIETTVNQNSNVYQQAIVEERNRIIKRIKNQICFDALKDADGRCEHHGGKCYELGLLVQELELQN
jgi:hypothetical protein